MPKNMFTVMFAIARTVCMVAQWMEMIGEDNQLLGRPRQLYVGPAKRDYIEMNKHR
jgi:citrate synthase